ncbi:MAG TPA: TetR/AcrR family transcriptional regulator [Acidimicrobiales bacterium]|nr:TetR/AcrR family transcriptional regulator [Acidimicrobiales bacterium]
MPDKSARERLLALVLDHFIAEGVGDVSLRQIAAAIGTSHRMLLYHFGSKDGLLSDVVRAVEERTRDEFTRIGIRAGDDPADVILQMWAHVADPRQGAFERLFFALYGRALQGDESLRPLLDGLIEPWLEANVTLGAANGVPPDIARAHARLGLAVTRGLLLDLLATGDRAAADAALALFAERYRGRWWEDAVARPQSGDTARAS